VPVIPFALTGQVGIPEDQVQSWTAILLACYSAALLVGSPAAGLYADHTSSRRWPLLMGLVALAGATLLLCFGPYIGLLVLGRLLQGFSAAVVWSVGCALLIDTMDNAVGVAMGYVNISMSLGLLIAPVVGGAIYGAVGYYPVYYLAFGIIAVDILLRLLMIEKKVASQWIQDPLLTAAGPAPDPNLDVEKADAAPRLTSAVGAETSSRGPGEADVVTDDKASPSVGADAGAATATAQELSHDDTASDPVTGLSPSDANQTATGERGKMFAIKLLLKSPRLLAALYGILVEASIM
jgi:MFS family permease